MEFMHLYIEQGRFGEFVDGILSLDFKRKQEEAEKENDDRLWLAYVHTMSEKPFAEWKKEVLEGSKEPESYSMTNEQVADTIQDVKGILKKISPV
ncbi:MAG: hypothetical protein IJZ23_06870 [Roseburia sp.]|nr:hypothetical protein [Roseburia sp.]MBQ8279547.1 hypothetical protein [Roseburia sp.]